MSAQTVSTAASEWTPERSVGRQRFDQHAQVAEPILMQPLEQRCELGVLARRAGEDRDDGATARAEDDVSGEPAQLLALVGDRGERDGPACSGTGAGSSPRTARRTSSPSSVRLFRSARRRSPARRRPRRRSPRWSRPRSRAPRRDEPRHRGRAPASARPAHGGDRSGSAAPLDISGHVGHSITVSNTVILFVKRSRPCSPTRERRTATDRRGLQRGRPRRSRTSSYRPTSSSTRTSGLTMHRAPRACGR